MESDNTAHVRIQLDNDRHLTITTVHPSGENGENPTIEISI